MVQNKRAKIKASQASRRRRDELRILKEQAAAEIELAAIEDREREEGDCEVAFWAKMVYYGDDGESSLVRIDCNVGFARHQLRTMAS